jgi:hypothetical protein
MDEHLGHLDLQVSVDASGERRASIVPKRFPSILRQRSHIVQPLADVAQRLEMFAGAQLPAQ